MYLFVLLFEGQNGDSVETATDADAAGADDSAHRRRRDSSQYFALFGVLVPLKALKNLCT